MITKTTVATVVGRRNKQQILKDFIRPSPATVTSSPIISIGGNGVGGGDCTGKPTGNKTPGIWAGGSTCEGEGEDYPDWLVTTIDTEGYTNTAPTPDEGSYIGTFIDWPILPMEHSTQFGYEEVERLRMSFSCGLEANTVVYGHFTMNGDMMSEPPQYSELDQFEDPRDLPPPYFSSEEPLPGTGLTEPTGEQEISYGDYGLRANRSFTIYPATDFSTKSWIGPTSFGDDYQPGALIYFFEDATGGHPLKVGTVLEEWLWVENANVSGQPFYQKAFRTGLTDPQRVTFALRVKPDETATLKIGNLVLYSFGTYTGFFDWSFARSSGSTASGGVAPDDRRDRADWGPLTVGASFSYYPPPQTIDSTIRIVDAVLAPNPDGTWFVPFTINQYMEVRFDGILMIEGIDYGVSGDLEIIPVEPLDEGAMVTARVEVGESA
jgi:hypothetical protein